MKTLHVDTGRDWRGGQAQVLHLARGLVARGHEATLLTPDGPLAERARAAGIAVRRLGARGEWNPFAAAETLAAIRAAGAGIVHAHSAHAHPPAAIAGALAGVPVVVSRRVDFAIARHAGSALKYRLPVARYLCISRGVRDVMRAGGVPESRLALVPSGVPLADRAAIAARAAAGPSLRALIGAPDSAPVVGTVAALAPHKDHATLLEAAALVHRERPDVRFAWLGADDGCEAALRRARTRLGLEPVVALLGFRDDALELLSQFTRFALSSSEEGLCTSLLDAQALGIPIVATRVGGIPDVVEDGVTGRLAPPRDPAAFARALVASLADEAGARAGALRAADAVRAFSVDAMVEGTLRVYDAVWRERTGAR